MYKAVLDDVHAVAVKMLAADQLKQLQLQAFVNEVRQLALLTETSNIPQTCSCFVTACHCTIRCSDFCWLLVTSSA